MARTARAAGLPLWLPITLIVIGLAGGAVPAFHVLSRLVEAGIDTFDAPTIDTPGAVGLELEADRYLVFERTGSTTAAGGGGVEVRRTRNELPALSPDLVEVVDLERGRAIPVHACSCNETITRGERVYTASLTFEVDRDGRHGLRVGGPPGEVIVTTSIGDTFDDVLGWLRWLVLPAVVLTVGVALLVVSLVTRRRSAA